MVILRGSSMDRMLPCLVGSMFDKELVFALGGGT